MRNYSIDTLHYKLRRHILLVKSFTEKPYMEWLIRSCRLKPYDFIFNERNKTLKLFNLWFDEFGNTLEILKNKNIKIIFNNLKINKQKVICTDLYYNLSLEKIKKISKLLMIIKAKDIDLHKECYMACFLGIDNYLRCYIYENDMWTKISPLSIGINNLKLLYQHLDIKYYVSVKNKKIFMPCQAHTTWISSLPASQDFLSTLDRQTNIIISTFFPERNLYKINAN